MTQQNAPCTITEELAVRRIRQKIRQIAENPVPGTPTGRVLDDVLDTTGKMLRPKLLLLCGSFGPVFTQRFDQLCIAGAAVELTHLASLIHDDIIDDAPFRRGKPSIQGRYGKDTAVYAGDFLIARIQRRLAEESMNDTLVRLSEAVERMCLGEIGQNACRYDAATSTEHYYRNIQGKTASLFRCACGIGAALGGCPEQVVQTLEQFGEALGMLFQLRDDLLDFTSTTAQEGKVTQKDFLDGIYTLPVLFTLQTPEGAAALQPLTEKNKTGTLSPAELEQMEQQVHRCGGVERTWEEIHRYARQARSLLAQLPETDAQKKLKGMLDQLDTRKPA